MTVGELRAVLERNPAADLHLMLPGGEFVPAHFHVTEVGRVRKDFIDCGGTVRTAVSCLVQVWVANDTAHRLSSSRLADIFRVAKRVLESDELPVEVEYESAAVSQYPVAGIEETPGGLLVHLGAKHTDCLAPDRCGVGGAACC